MNHKKEKNPKSAKVIPLILKLMHFESDLNSAWPMWNFPASSDHFYCWFCNQQ